jgi:hypothetical protein
LKSQDARILRIVLYDDRRRESLHDFPGEETVIRQFIIAMF